jgi:hypothetical protein
MLVLQSCTDPLYILPHSPNETFPTSSAGVYVVGNIKVEKDVDVTEESFIGVSKQADAGKTEEEITGVITFPDVKAEPDEVRYVCVCVL